MEEKVILSTAYLAPIQYFTKLIKYDKVLIELNDNFIKQTYRNRCKIYGANGILQLSIPIKKDKPKTLVKDILIDYDTNWQKMHWKSIESAYKSSPFFEFYSDELIEFYQKRYKYLYDFNMQIQSTIMEFLDMQAEIKFTEVYLGNYEQVFDDFRDKIHPKKEFRDLNFALKEYNQVFIEKHGFMPNLSIIDLIFNEGPNAVNFLV